MIWSAPAAFWLAASLGVILVLHGIRMFRRRMPTTTLWIWRELAKESHTSLRLERIVRNLPLLLQLLLAALLVLALAQPLWFRQVAFDKDVVVVVDSSASMNTRVDGTTRFEKAREAALGLVDDLNDGQRMAIVQMAHAPRLVQAFTGETPKLEAALKALQPTDEEAPLKPTLLFALSLAKDLEDRQVVLIGDGAYHETDGAESILNDTVTFIPIEGGDDNEAIVQFAYRAYPPPLQGGELLLGLKSYAKAPHEVTARVTLEGRAPMEKQITLDPGATTAAVIPVPEGALGVAHAELLPSDALDADNHAYAVITTTPMAQVLLVGQAEPPLHAVMQSLPDINVTYRDSLDHEFEDGKLGHYDLMVFNAVRPPPIESGTLAVLGETAPRGGVRAAGWIENPHITGWRPEDPLLRYVDAQRLQVKRALRLVLDPGTVPLVDAVEGPLITRYESGNLRVVTIGFNLGESRLAADDAFPLFMANLVDWARPRAGASPIREVAAGDTLDWRSTPGAPGLEVDGPDGGKWSYPAGEDTIHFGETRHVGVYLFRSGAKAEPFAVNLLDARESDTSRNPDIVGRAASEGEGRGFGEVALEGWPWFIAAGLLFLLVEWLVWSRFS